MGQSMSSDDKVDHLLAKSSFRAHLAGNSDARLAFTSKIVFVDEHRLYPKALLASHLGLKAPRTQSST